MPCVVSVTSVGIKLSELNSSNLVQQGLIPERNVADISVNRLQPHCILCVVKDDSSELLNVMVWRCRHQRDVTDILKCFIVDKEDGKVTVNIRKYQSMNGSTAVQTNTSKAYKRPISGDVERYDTNGHVVVQTNSKKVYKSQISIDRQKVPTNGPGVRVYHHARITSDQSMNDDVFVNGFGGSGKHKDKYVQTDPVDLDGSFSDVNVDALKDELTQLQKQVKHLKLMVQHPDVSNSQYFKKRRIDSHGTDRLEYVPVNGHYQNYKYVKPEHDMRSYAIQTDKKRTYYVSRRTGRETTRHAPRKSGHYVLVRKHRRSHSEPRHIKPSNSSSLPRNVRLTSDTSDIPNDPLVWERSSEEDKKKVLGYVTLPPETNEVYRNAQPDQRVNQPPPSPSPFILRSTVQKPIENVYGSSRYRKNDQVYRNRKGITPYTFTGANGRLSSGDETKLQTSTDLKPVMLGNGVL